MKNKTQKIIAFVIAIIIGFIDYINLIIGKSMCYYFGDGLVMSPESREGLRNLCYSKYTLNKVFFEVFIVSLIAYVLCLYAFSLFKKKESIKQ